MDSNVWVLVIDSTPRMAVSWLEESVVSPFVHMVCSSDASAQWYYYPDAPFFGLSEAFNNKNNVHFCVCRI